MPRHRYTLASIDMSRGIWHAGDVGVTVTLRCENCGVEACTSTSLFRGKQEKAFTIWGDAQWQDIFETEPMCRPSGNHQTPPDKIERIISLGNEGASVREIASRVGVHRDTVSAHLGPRDHSAGMRRWHARRKAEGRPILPPWRRTK